MSKLYFITYKDTKIIIEADSPESASKKALNAMIMKDIVDFPRESTITMIDLEGGDLEDLIKTKENK